MNISYSQIQNEYNELCLLASKIKENYNNLSSLNQSLTKSGYWLGKASEYYVSKMNNVLKNYEVIYSEIKSDAEYLLQCMEKYKNIDKQIMNSVGNLNIMDGAKYVV